jgi:hypothetical protein
LAISSTDHELRRDGSGLERPVMGIIVEECELQKGLKEE